MNIEISKKDLTESKINENTDNLKTTRHMIYGPPFPSSSCPHAGHLLNMIMKDIILSLSKQLGYETSGDSVVFDVHGLPTELKVQELIKQETGIDGMKEILEKIGLAEYNQKCINYLNEVMSAWPATFKNLTPGIQFKGESTMSFDYMNSLWWCFSELYKKDLIYIGNKVQYYSAECETVISNFEAKQNYKSVTENTIYVNFKVCGHDGLVGDNTSLYLIVWTTTPFTLFANTALCINQNIKYVTFRLKGEKSDIRNKWYISSKQYATSLGEQVVEIKEIEAYDILKLEYEPIFKYNTYMKTYRILSDNYVTESSGTGIVHLAPSYGMDDFRVCEKNGIIERCGKGAFDPTDSRMRFTNVVPEFMGKEARQCNNDIIKLLRLRDVLFREETITHELPHCWRTDTVLYFKLVETVNLDIQKIKPEMLANLEKVKFIGPGKERLRNNIETAPDWPLSRTRIFGTSIPMWRCIDKNSENSPLVISSAAELEKICGYQPGSIKDLHTDKLPTDIYTADGKHYKWIGYTFDVWYESGAQPFCQSGYPYTGKSYTIADFIIEGMDQTRGWFYTLLVLGTALIGTSPYKTILVNGLLLDKNGVKFSKRLKNYRGLEELECDYGVDAVRLYFISSPASIGQTIKFDETGIKVYNKSVIIPLTNVLNLFIEYYEFYKQRNMSEKLEFVGDSDMDIWIRVKLERLLTNIKHYHFEYQLEKISESILEFTEFLTNGYCKFNRNSIKGKESVSEWKNSLATLHYVLKQTAWALKCIIPVTSNLILDKLQIDKNLLVGYPSTSLLENSEYLAKEKIMDFVIKQIHTVLAFRGLKNISQKKPFLKVIFPVDGNIDINYLSKYSNLLKTETNTLDVEFTELSTDNYMLKFIPDFKAIGKEYGKLTNFLVQNITNSNINGLIAAKIKAGENYNYIAENNCSIELSLKYGTVEEQYNNLDGYVTFSHNGMTIYIDNSSNAFVVGLYNARLFATSIQKYRKEKGLKVTDSVQIKYKALNTYTRDIINSHIEYIEKILNRNIVETVDEISSDNLVVKNGDLEYIVKIII